MGMGITDGVSSYRIASHESHFMNRNVDGSNMLLQQLGKILTAVRSIVRSTLQ